MKTNRKTTKAEKAEMNRNLRNLISDKLAVGTATKNDLVRLARLLGTPRSEMSGTIAHFEAMNHNNYLRTFPNGR